MTQLSLLSQLERFHKASLGSTRTRAAWLSHDPVDVYVRLSPHLPPNYERGCSLCIANIIVDEGHRRQGHFRRMLSDFTHWAKSRGYRLIYFENVNNRDIWDFLTEEEFQRMGESEVEGVNFFKQL